MSARYCGCLLVKVGRISSANHPEDSLRLLWVYSTRPRAPTSLLASTSSAVLQPFVQCVITVKQRSVVVVVGRIIEA